MPVWGWLLIILAVVVAAIAALPYFGNKMQEKQVAQKEQMMMAAQPQSMLIIDKKIMPLKDAKLPKAVYEEFEKKGKRYTKAKVPIVKVKIGPQIMNLLCDDAIYEDVPSRGEVKAMVSGIYIVGVKQVRGKKNTPVEEEGGKKKKGGFRQRLMRKQAEYQKELSAEVANKKSKEQIKAEKEKKKKNEERAKKITV